MRADFRTLFDNANSDVGALLLDAYRGGEACRACTDDQYVVFHRITLGHGDFLLVRLK